MTARWFGILGGLVAVGTALAQYITPAWSGFHTWQFAALVVVALIVLGNYAGPALRSRGSEREPDTRRAAGIALAVAGAFTIAIAGLAAGLLGPDTQTVARAPGVVAPLPDVGAAAFFPSANAAAIARGDAVVTLRERSGAQTAVAPGATAIVGPTAIQLVPQHAAFIEARDARGGHLTITQPTNPAFLSPVLLFPTTVSIAGRTVPSDTFAVPALHRAVKAIYFSKDASAGARTHGFGDTSTVLFAVDDDAGRGLPGAIGFVPSGGRTVLGGLALRASIGTYPALVISAVPYPAAVWAGGAAIALGLVLSALPRPRAPVVVARRPQPGVAPVPGVPEPIA